MPVQSELLLAALPWGVLVLAADGTVAYLNAAAAALWGVPAADVLGRQPASVVPAVLPPAVVQALSQPAAEPADYWLPHTQQWVSLRTAPAPEDQRWVFWDNVTARRQAEQTLRSQRELLQRTIDSSLDLVQVFEAVRDEQGAVVDFRWVLNNAAAERVYGDVIGQRLCQLNPGVVEAGIFDTFRRVLETGVPDQSERHYVHEQFNGWFYQSTVKQGDGVTTTTRDITARKQAEQELRQSQHLLQTVFDVSLNPIAYHKAVRDAAGRIIDFEFQLRNRQAHQYAAPDEKGRRYSEAYPGILESEVFRLYCAVVETGQPLDAEVPFRLRGADRWFRLQAVKLDDGLVATAVDVTERRQEQAELLRLQVELAQQATHNYRALLEATTQGFCRLQLLFDEAGQQAVDFRYLELNPAFVAHSGLGPGALGKTISELVPNLEPRWLETYGRVALTGQAEHLEYPVAQLGRWYDAHAFRVGPPEARQVGVLFSDITARKHTEERLRAAAAAETFRRQLADALGPLTEAEDIQDAVTRTARLHFGADRCYYCEIIGEQAIIRRDAATAGLPPVAGTYPLAQFALLQAVIEAGRPFVVRDVRQDPSVDENLRQLCVQLQVISYLDVPVIKNGQAVGVLCLVQSQPRDWTAADAGLAAEVAERTWAAVERARAEKALRESQEELSAFVNATSDVLYEMSADWRLLYPFDGKDFVASAAEPNADWMAGYLPEDERERVWAAIYRATAARSTYDLVHRVRRQDGTIGWVHSRATPILNEAGDIVKWFGTASDITEHKLAEEALRASEEKFRTLFESIDEGFCIIELVADEQDTVVDYRFLEVNAVFERQTGVTGARGRLVSELVPATERHWLDVYAQVARTGQAARHENFHAGTGRWFNVYASRVDGPGSREVCVVFDDITERKRRERQQAFLLRFSDELRAHANEQTVEETGLQLLAEFLRLDRSYVFVLYPSEDRAVVRAEYRAAHLPSLLGEVRMSDFPETVRQIEDATIVFDDIDRDARLSALNRASLAAANLQSFVCVSARKGEKEVVWSLAAASATPRTWANDEIEFIETAAERLWAAVTRTKAEAALRESEERFRTVANLVPDLLWYSTPDSDTTWYNQQWYEYTGQTPEDAAGYGWTEVIHPDDRAASARRYRQAVTAGQPLRQEHRIRSAAGEYRWFQVRARPFRNAQGEVTAWFGAATDIHARKQAELALAASEQRLQALITNLPGAAVFIVDRELRYQLAEGEALHQVGYTAADFRGRLVREMAPPGQWPTYREQYTRALAGQPFEHEHAQGGRTFLTRGVPLAGPDGAVEAVLAVSYDITARQQAEEALRQNEAQLEQQVADRTQELRESRDWLQSVFDTSLIAMSVMQAVRDAAGHITDFRILVVNKELENQTGRHDLVGKLYAQEYPGIVEVGIFERLLRTVATGQPQHLEYYYGHDGLRNWYSSQFVKLGDGIVATNLDITERKQAEEERFRNLQLLAQAEAVASLGSWDYDLATNAMRWSDGMYQLFGLPPGQSVGPEVYQQFVVAEDSPRAEQLVARLKAGTDGFEETLRLRVGEQSKTLRIKAVVLRDETARPVRLLGVDLDISELQRLEADNLRLRLTRQQALFEAVQTAQEDERKRIAEGLHNGVGQTLYATKLQFDQLQPLLPGEAWQKSTTLLADAIRQTRAISHELVPMVLNEFGLAPALTDICRTLSSSGLRFRCDIDLDELTQPLPPLLQLAVYRMAQELAQNIVKHAQATEATLTLEAVPGCLLLRAEDNGVGFPTGTIERPGLGLRSIRDRVALLGGTVDMGSAPSVGTYVRLRIPLPSSD